MRVRITFAKTDHMRYTSHLDLHRTWERSLRRARLPLSYSQGFNPRPKLNLAAALPLGFTSQCEIVDVWLDEAVPLEEIEASLAVALPPGIMLQSLQAVTETSAKLPNLVDTAEFWVTLLDPIPELEIRVRDLLAAEQLPRQRRKKTYDLRPLVEDLVVLEPDLAGQQRLAMRLVARESATGRPEEVLLALGIDPHSARVQRTRLHIRQAIPG